MIILLVLACNPQSIGVVLYRRDLRCNEYMNTPSWKLPTVVGTRLETREETKVRHNSTAITRVNVQSSE